jgi:hypothetical protein
MSYYTHITEVKKMQGGGKAKASPKKPALSPEAKEAFNKIPKLPLRNQGNLGVAPKAYGAGKKAIEVLANPAQSFGHYAKYGELPADGFSKNAASANAFDNVLAMRNPASWINHGTNAISFASNGEYLEAGKAALGAIPVGGGVGRVASKALPALGTGTKAIGAGVKALTGTGLRTAETAIAKTAGRNLLTYETLGIGGGRGLATAGSKLAAAGKAGLKSSYEILGIGGGRGLSTAGKAGLKSSYEILELGGGRGLATTGNAAVRTVGAKAIGAAGERGLQVVGGRAGAGALARVAKNGLSDVGHLNTVYSHPQLSTIAGLVTAVGIEEVTRKYFGGDKNKAKAALSTVQGTATPKMWGAPEATKAWKDASAPIKRGAVTLTPVVGHTAVPETDEVAKGILDAERLSANKSALRPEKSVVNNSSNRASSGGSAGAGGSGAGSAGKGDSPETTRIKRIQQSLRVKADGIWGPKTAAAFEAAKKTQESLGFTGKDVDGIIGTKTKAALKTQDDELHTNVEALKESLKPKIEIPEYYSRTKREIRQDLREIRRNEREARRASRNVEEFNLRTGGILYGCRK